MGTASELRMAAPGLYAAVVALALLMVMAAGFFPRTVSSTQPAPSLRAAQLALPGTAGAVAWSRPAELPLSVPEPIQPPLVNPSARPSYVPVREGAAAVAEGAGSVVIEVDGGQAAIVASAPVEAVLAEREQAPQPLFFRYEVRDGDTVSGIAGRFGIAPEYILWNNIDIINDADVLQIGQQLQVPSVPGIIHGVRVGETLIEIADRYDAKVSRIIQVNRLRSDGMIRAGEPILVPDGRIVAPPEPTVRPTPVAAAAVAPSSSSSEFKFVWPTSDTTITSYFGPSHPLGIDVRADVGDPIKAAADGRVIFVGGARCCSYGLYVEVQHDGGFTTLYAHLRDFAVSNGDEVTAGQILGFAGLTGRTTGPHLHFEIERHGVRRDPLLYLP